MVGNAAIGSVMLSVAVSSVIAFVDEKMVYAGNNFRMHDDFLVYWSILANINQTKSNWLM
jgi:hypothetical protein